MKAFEHVHDSAHRLISIDNIAYVEFHGGTAVTIHFGDGLKLVLAEDNTGLAETLYRELGAAMEHRR